MKIGLMILSVIIFLAISPTALVSSWIITSPFVNNFIARPDENPFFGSYRLIDLTGHVVPGFDIRELFTFDRAVLLTLFIITLFRATHKITLDRLDIVFLTFLGSAGLSTLFSKNFVHAVKVAFDSFGLSYIAYFLGKNMLYWEDKFKKYIRAVLTLGVTLVVVTLCESYINRDTDMYRITGPFLYWENLGLTLAIILFIALFRVNTIKLSSNRVSKGFQVLILLLAICIFLSYTRTIMFVVLLGLLYCARKGNNVINKRTISKYNLFVVSIIIITALSPLLLSSTGFYQHRLTKRTDEGRIENYYVAMRMFMQHPLLGIGFKNYDTEQVNYATEEEIKKGAVTSRGSCHNSYLVIAAEMGLMGFIPMILLVVFSYTFCRQYYSFVKTKEEKLWALTMGTLTIIYFLSATTFDPFHEPTIDNKLFYMCLGLSVGRYNILKNNS